MQFTSNKYSIFITLNLDTFVNKIQTSLDESFYDINQFSSFQTLSKNYRISGEGPKMAAQEDPELTSFHRPIESPPTYRAILPEEDLRAD